MECGVKEKADWAKRIFGACSVVLGTPTVFTVGVSVTAKVLWVPAEASVALGGLVISGSFGGFATGVKNSEGLYFLGKMDDLGG